ncbi:MAG: hypothetical protein NC548_26990, partial [Lachnospiraceae bacterium]|nr:hypothetical protein [Lachnospiraceae bacterium]
HMKCFKCGQGELQPITKDGKAYAQCSNCGVKFTADDLRNLAAQKTTKTPPQTQENTTARKENFKTSLISCPDCGKEVSAKASSCPNCGCPIAAPETQRIPDGFVDSSNKVIKYPKCRSTNVSFQLQETSSKTKKKKNSLLHNAARKALVFGTFGFWALVPEADGKEYAKIKSGTFAVCQSCGKTWKVK